MHSTLTRRSAAWLRRLGSLLSPADPHGAGGGARRVILPRRDDSFHHYPSVGMTPARVLSYLHAADAGAPRLQFELFDEMLQKWPRLAAVEATRRLALTGLEWEIHPADEHAAKHNSGIQSARTTGQPTEPDPVQIADHCRRSLASLDGFRDALDHLAGAIGHGIAVAELVWERGELVDVVPVPCSRLAALPEEPWRLRVLTDAEPTHGIALDEAPAKWVVHVPRSRTGRPFEGGLLRASALLYVAQSLSLKDWLVYSQIAGMPVRVAQFEPGVSDGEQRNLLRMLEKLGTESVAVFSKNVELKLLEGGSAAQRPYEPIQKYCNTEVTILWLGQHLTTDIGTSGSRAAAEVHDRVREDLLVDDIADEAQTIRRDMLTPLVRAHFGPAAPVPHFARSLIQSVDTRVLAQTLAVAVNQLGLRVPTRWVHRALGIPEPRQEEPVLAREIR